MKEKTVNPNVNFIFDKHSTANLDSVLNLVLLLISVQFFGTYKDCYSQSTIVCTLFIIFTFFFGGIRKLQIPYEKVHCHGTQARLLHKEISWKQEFERWANFWFHNELSVLAPFFRKDKLPGYPDILISILSKMILAHNKLTLSIKCAHGDIFLEEDNFISFLQQNEERDRRESAYHKTFEILTAVVN